MSGYFDGLAYEWSDQNRVYTVSMSQQDYRQFLKNKGEESCQIQNFKAFNSPFNEFSRYNYLLTMKTNVCFYFSEAAGGDAWASQTKMLFLTEEEFNEYKTKGYFRGIKYRWTSQDGSYTVYISKSSYDKLRQNMESGPNGKNTLKLLYLRQNRKLICKLF